MYVLASTRGHASHVAWLPATNVMRVYAARMVINATVTAYTPRVTSLPCRVVHEHLFTLTNNGDKHTAALRERREEDGVGVTICCC